MERAVAFTGIGGQGVQLAAQVLARAAVHDGLEAQFLGVYEGAMRGMSSQATVVVADGPITAPPLGSRLWAAVVLHHAHWPELQGRLDPDHALVVVDADVATIEPPAHAEVLWVPASRTAAEVGNRQGAGMVLLGALAAHTGLVSVEGLVAGMREALPPYRAGHAPGNEAAIRAGARVVVG